MSSKRVRTELEFTFRVVVDAGESLAPEELAALQDCLAFVKKMKSPRELPPAGRAVQPDASMMALESLVQNRHSFPLPTNDATREYHCMCGFITRAGSFGWSQHIRHCTLATEIQAETALCSVSRFWGSMRWSCTRPQGHDGQCYDGRGRRAIPSGSVGVTPA